MHAANEMRGCGGGLFDHIIGANEERRGHIEA